MVVEGKGGDESTERGSVHDGKQWTKNGALGNTTGGGTQVRESVVTSDTEGAKTRLIREPYFRYRGRSDPSPKLLRLYIAIL